MSDKEAVEAVAAIVFEAMRFDREDEVPKWAGGNSHAENEARSKAIAIIAAARPHILEEAARIADEKESYWNEFAYDTRQAGMDDSFACASASSAWRIAATIRAAKEG